MKKALTIFLLIFLLVNCKRNSERDISKPSNDTNIYYKNLFKNGFIKDSIASINFDIASEYSSKGEYEKSKSFYLKSNEIEPNNKFILNALGIVSADLKEMKDCVGYFEASLKKDSLYSVTYMNYGAAYNRLKKFNKSIEVLNRGLKLEKSLEIKGYFYYNLANALYKKKDYQKANEFNNMALAIVKLPAAKEDIIELKNVLNELID